MESVSSVGGVSDRDRIVNVSLSLVIIKGLIKRPSHVKLNVGQLVLANSNWRV